MRNIFKKQRIKLLILAAILIVTIYAGFVWQAQEQKKAPSFLLAWGSQGSGPGQFYNPWGVAVDSSGNVYVADYGNDRVEKFTSSGTFVTQWGSVGSGPGQFVVPVGVAVDSSGNVYVADTGNNRVQKFTGSGSFITQWGLGLFNYPIGVAIDSSGNVYVVDSGNNRVVKFTGDGKYITQLGNSTTPSGVAIDSSGNVYVTDSGNNRVQKFRSVPIIPVEQVLIIAIVAGVLAFIILKRPKNLQRRIMPHLRSQQHNSQ
jgi:DNA-binding beta-propeller fold protein YncE